MPVAVVTDSTAYLPAELAAAYGIGIVPLQVTAGGRPTTSQPAPAAFLAAFEACPPGDICAVHLSGALSGTVGAAAAAGERSGRTVEVVDSRQIGMGLGFAAVAAAAAARSGAALPEVCAAAR